MSVPSLGSEWSLCVRGYRFCPRFFDLPTGFYTCSGIMVPSVFHFITACRLFVLKVVINKTHQYCANLGTITIKYYLNLNSHNFIPFIYRSRSERYMWDVSKKCVIFSPYLYYIIYTILVLSKCKQTLKCDRISDYCLLHFRDNKILF
jgi:hypothetical protein